MQPAQNPERLTFDGIVSLLSYIHSGDVEIISLDAGRITEATIKGHPADARWLIGMWRLMESDEATVKDGKITLTNRGEASLARAWPAAPSLRRGENRS